MKSLPSLLLTGCLALLLAGCAGSYNNTRLLDARMNPEATARAPYHSVVVGVLISHQMRPTLEKLIVEKLRFMGVNATSAYSIYGNKGIEGKSLDYLEQRMREHGFDSALAVHLVEKTEETVHITSDAPVPVPPSYGLSMQPEVFGPDFFVKEDIYQARSEFWDVSQQKIIWTANTVTINPHGLLKGGDRFAETIATHLVRTGLFKNTQ